MTVTVEAGVTVATLAATLAENAQQIPVDAPRAAEATIGGLVATAWSGPRRYGHGTMRDYVIGITAVDGRGVTFHGGGRVVKNVAGYDFCKLLTGSLGSLGVITQITLRVKPVPEQSALLACELSDLDQAERLLAELVHFETPSAAIELLAGPAWRADSDLPSSGDAIATLVVALEGTDEEVTWMRDSLTAAWRQAGVAEIETYADQRADRLWSQLTEFPADGESPLVVQANVLPSAVTEYLRFVKQIDPDCSVQSHAGNGVLVVRFAEVLENDPARLLVSSLRPAAARCGGSAIVLKCPGEKLTQQAHWGLPGAAAGVMEKVRKEFDPHDLFNRAAR